MQLSGACTTLLGMQEPTSPSSWRAAVEEYLVRTRGRTLSSIEEELGALPLELGEASGDSAAEFVEAAIAPLLQEGGR